MVHTPLFDDVGEWVIRNWKQIRQVENAKMEAEDQCQVLVTRVETLLSKESWTHGMRRDVGKGKLFLYLPDWFDDKKDVGFRLTLRELNLTGIFDGGPNESREPPWIGVKWNGPVGTKEERAIQNLYAAAKTKKYELSSEDELNNKDQDLCWRYVHGMFTPENILDGSIANQLVGILRELNEDLGKDLSRCSAMART